MNEKTFPSKMYKPEDTDTWARGNKGELMGLSLIHIYKCDYIVSIPMRGRVNSLNASNAAAVLLFEALRRRTQGN